MGSCRAPLRHAQYVLQYVRTWLSLKMKSVSFFFCVCRWEFSMSISYRFVFKRICLLTSGYFSPKLGKDTEQLIKSMS